MQHAEQKAIDLLARREHSRGELEQKLKARHFDDAEIQGALDACESKGYLSNERFMTMYIEHRRSQGYGPMRIRSELRAKGIDNKLIHQHLDREQGWVNLIRAIRLKKFGVPLPKDSKDRAKQIRFLLSRGFHLTQINQAFNYDNDF